SLIVGSDIGYDPDLFEALLQTLVAQSSDSTEIYQGLADREEDEEPNVQDFIDAVAHLFSCEVVHQLRFEPYQSLTKVVRMKRKVQPEAVG
ncbi:unnamed protein product, partial [Polarella glacialis]